ncbi:hypothetical protein D0T49_01905 [Paludibacter sp. 221]|uniref:hypothetical protein n=1 Tax=Paludibacter sp. 221 TaxID=2302939 RepID=UPI0013D1037F|nr:hypothetical protein [Paludibacter sp. 221]NDV45804.1 hypothetical protein [Paludibacter sp. 221]
MKTIPLNKGSINLPEYWDELTPKQVLICIGLLHRVLSMEMDPGWARLEMLFAIIRYKPDKSIKDESVRENINFNLIRLSEQLTFAFTIEQVDNETVKRIVPHFNFRRNPMPLLKIGKKKYAGKIFNMDITVKTDIVAKEFIDAFDLYTAINKLEDPSSREECLNQLCAILYPSHPEHQKNLVSGQIEQMRMIEPVKKLLIFYWFTGIIRFYTEHPVYSLLFSGGKEKSEDKIGLGMNATALHLTKQGYGSMDNMPLNDYFDAQIQSLKDTISKALADGVKIAEIANQTGISISTIEKLS